MIKYFCDLCGKELRDEIGTTRWFKIKEFDLDLNAPILRGERWKKVIAHQECVKRLYEEAK